MRRNRIDIKDTEELFQAYGIQYRHLNFYTMRLKQEETRVMWDWFHTTGTVIKHENGRPQRSKKKFRDPEEVAEYILKQIYHERNI